MSYKVISPKNREELLQTIEENQNNRFRFGAGYTDLILELKGKNNDDLTVINLAAVRDNAFTSINEVPGGLMIGSLTKVCRIADNEMLAKNFPVLSEAAQKLASYQIREVATIGGNVCVASPSGDLACALVSLKAECELLATNGSCRRITITEFLTGLRTTDLKKNEILQGLFIPNNSAGRMLLSDFIKIGVRNAMECSVVSMGYHMVVDRDEKIIQAGIAIGAVAPTIRFVNSACDFLIGKVYTKLNKEDCTILAGKVMEYASPITDVRGSEWYRKEVLHNISMNLFDEKLKIHKIA